MIDSGSASSHIVSKVIEENQIQTHRREVPLQILGSGNKKFDPIPHNAHIKLSGKYGEVEIRLNVQKNTIVSDLPEVSGQILERFPHIINHPSNPRVPITKPKDLLQKGS